MALGKVGLGDGIITLAGLKGVEALAVGGEWEQAMKDFNARLSQVLSAMFSISAQATASTHACRARPVEGSVIDELGAKSCCKFDEKTVSGGGSSRLVNKTKFKLTVANVGELEFSVEFDVGFTAPAPPPPPPAPPYLITYTKHGLCAPPLCQDETLDVDVPVAFDGKVKVTITSQITAVKFMEMLGANSTGELKLQGVQYIKINVPC